MQAEEGLARLRALGFGRDETLTLWEHFDHAEQQWGSSATGTRASSALLGDADGLRSEGAPAADPV